DLRTQRTNSLLRLIVTPIGAGTNLRLKGMHLVPRLGLGARGAPPCPRCGLVHGIAGSLKPSAGAGVILVGQSFYRPSIGNGPPKLGRREQRRALDRAAIPHSRLRHCWRAHRDWWRPLAV